MAAIKATLENGLQPENDIIVCVSHKEGWFEKLVSEKLDIEFYIFVRVLNGEK